AGLAAALALGTSTTFWAQATISNVRTLAGFFTALAVYALVRHKTEIESHKDRAKDSFLILFVAALVLGLTHHFSLVFIDFFLILGLILVDRPLFRQPRRWPLLILAALLCLIPLVYLPLRAPDTIGTVQGFFHYVLALGFSGDFLYFRSLADLIPRLGVMFNVLSFQFHSLILAGGLLGLIIVWKNRHLNLALIGGFIAHTLATATYRAPQTVEYMLPAYVLFVIIFGAGLARFGNYLLEQRLPLNHDLAARTDLSAKFLLYPVILILFLIAGLAQGIVHYPSYRWLAQSRDTRNTLTPILEGAPQNAIVLADWHWFKPMSYLQRVEGMRPDLVIQYVAPANEPYEETWARRIREELPLRPVVVTHFHELAYAGIPAIFEPLGAGILVRSEPRREIPDGFAPAGVDFGDALTVLGYRFEDAPSRLDQPFSFVLAWSPGAVLDAPVTLFAHLVGAGGGLYAQQDVILDLENLAAGDVALTRFTMEPRPGALPGSYSLQVGAYTPEDSLLTGSGQTRETLLNLEIEPSTRPLFTGRPRREKMGNNLILVGIDWDLTLSAQPRLYLHWHAQKDAPAFSYTLTIDDNPITTGHVPDLPAGSFQTTVHTLPGPTGQLLLIPQAPAHKNVRIPIAGEFEQYVPFGDGIVYLGSGRSSKDLNPPVHKFSPRFAASFPIQRDYVVSTSLIGLNEDTSWAWRELDDGVPAMGAIPTLKWITGSMVVDPHRLTIPGDAPACRVIGTLALYDAFTGRPLGLLDERLAAAAPWAPLGEWVLPLEK
ncbi:MAG: DUF2723 domain-containing protein, partial [Anaerolineales bacterium]|nr:DUF2723 domain-containing protein [Anaerolineales bacterium]